MLQNLRKYFYDNKIVILRNILVVVFVLLIIQGVNYLVRVEADLDNKVSINNEFTYGNLIDFSNTVNKNNTIISNQTQNQNGIISNSTTGDNSIIGGIGTGYNNEIGSVGGNNVGSSTDSNLSKDEEALNHFLDLCIEGSVEQAYSLLSEECKTVLFPTIEKFEKNYYYQIFGSNKVYTVEHYYSNTYKVRVAQDMNTTGSYTALAHTDYITVKYVDEGIKLNVGNYIGRYNINTSDTEEDITVTVNYKDVFMSYERYNITVNNGHEGIIMLNSSNSSNTMYLTDKDGNKYYAYTHEIVGSSLILITGSTVDFNIKYDSSYGQNANYKDELVFSNVILDYETYRKLEDKSNYKDICSIQVEI